MHEGSLASGHLGDTHMLRTLQAVFEACARTRRAVVWAHNSQIGDAREIEMGAAGAS